MGHKTNYVVYYRNLQLYLSLGIKLTKIQETLKFKQSDWLKKNTLTLTLKKEKIQLIILKKIFFNLMINCVYGKTMENLRKWISVILVNNEEDYLKHVSKTIFISQKIFDKNFAAIHEIKPVLKFKKPIYVGFTVLELY